jgi:hypothetical protein
MHYLTPGNLSEHAVAYFSSFHLQLVQDIIASDCQGMKYITVIKFQKLENFHIIENVKLILKDPK